MITWCDNDCKRRWVMKTFKQMYYEDGHKQLQKLILLKKES